VLPSLRCSLLTLGCLAIFHSTLLDGQVAGRDAAGPIVFQANAQSVVLDVVVTGRNGQPAEGLHKGDFLLSEDDHPQTITSFEEHTGTQPIQAPLPAPPPDIFTNIPRVKPTESVTILLLDSLNTLAADQSMVRDQMLKYVKRLQPDRPVAIFDLGTRLRLLQGFTTDPAALTDALNKKKSATPLLWSDAQLEADQYTVDSPKQAPQFSQAQEQLHANEKADQPDKLVEATLNALKELARSVAGIPGRKNVVWLSGAFPSVIFADPELRTTAGGKLGWTDPFSVVRNHEDEIRKTDALLAEAEVAVYPIAAEGLATGVIDIDRQTNKPYSMQQMQIHETEQRNANQATMDQIARETGGIAFYNTNGLNDALGQVMDHGSHFYTLTYAPPNSRPDGQYRKIEIKLSSGGYKLAYRPGYYAVTGKTAVAASGDHPLQPSMRPGMPDSTQIHIALQVQAQSPDQVDKIRTHAGDNAKLKGRLTRYTVEFGVAAHDLQLDAAPDGTRRGKMESGLFVYDRDGKALNWIVKDADLQMDAAHYKWVQANGVRFSMEIDVPKSGVYLQGGIYDQLSNQIGTLQIPLKSVGAEQTTGPTALADALSGSPYAPQGNPVALPSGTLSVALSAIPGQKQIASSTLPPRPENNHAAPPSVKDLPHAHATAAMYVDDPLQKLKTAVPTLNGLKYDANQDQLSSILTRLAQTTENVLLKLPDLVSREEIFHGAQGSVQPISVALNSSSAEDTTSQRYKYLIICHRTPDGTNLEESRIDIWDRPVQPDQGSLLAYGFAYQWLLFSKATQAEFRFKYLGEQPIDGKKTFVLAFAQKPEQVKVPPYFMWGGKRVPVFYQGVLWIDQSTSNIALIRTDLLGPLPSSQLEGLTTELRFRSVHIRDLSETFWLPRELHIVVRQTKAAAEENHLYSDYHLYHASVRMVPSP